MQERAPRNPLSAVRIAHFNTPVPRESQLLSLCPAQSDAIQPLGAAFENLGKMKASLKSDTN
jgi:hypothetical protein